MTRIAQNHPAFPQWLKISQAISAHRKEMRRLKAEREELVESSAQRAKAANRAERRTAGEARPESHGSGPGPMSHRATPTASKGDVKTAASAAVAAGRPLSVNSRILGFLLDNQGQAFTPSEVAQGVGLPAAREVRSQLRKLVRQNKVLKADKKHYAI